MTVRRIGNATIEKVEEICGSGFKPARMFPKFDQEAFDAQKGWMLPEHVEPGSDRLVGSVHTWVLKTGRHTILIDTCLGNHKQRQNAGWNNLDTPFLERLRACGCSPESVDLVMCTHLHVDHVGWNTKLENGRWVPTFPNAKYVFSREDYEHYRKADADPEKGPANLGSFRDSVLPVVEAGLAQIVAGAADLDEYLKIEPAPGHTPGTIAIKFESKGERAIFCGDIIHHALQVHRPHWNSFACLDGASARTSRRRVLEHCAGGALLMPAHFGAPFACHVESRGEGFEPRFAS
jgi:glyoxylase-like metal-dependent hydrolase (beta-lactamase superfamily II)